MPRHIRLDIAPATATHCGQAQEGRRVRCRHYIAGVANPRCRIFSGHWEYPEDEDEPWFPQRLPECLAAEKGASERP